MFVCVSSVICEKGMCLAGHMVDMVHVARSVAGGAVRLKASNQNSNIFPRFISLTLNDCYYSKAP